MRWHRADTAFFASRRRSAPASHRRDAVRHRGTSRRTHTARPRRSRRGAGHRPDLDRLDPRNGVPGLFHIGGDELCDDSTPCEPYLGATFNPASIEVLAPDSDDDGHRDDVDACLLRPNPERCDTNADGSGNLCDADYNADNVVELPDLTLLIGYFGDAVPPAPADLDADCNGGIGLPDITETGLPAFNLPPGPSGLAYAGLSPCGSP